LTNIEFLDVLKLCREEAKNSEEKEKKKKLLKKRAKVFFCNLEGKILKQFISSLRK
jgi:hypothetical protein